MDFTAWKCSLSGERVFSESCGSFSFAFDWRKVLCSFFPFSHPLQYYFFFSWWFSIFVSVCCTLKTHQNKSFCAEVYPLKLLLNFTVLNEFPWIWICRCVTQRETIWRKLRWWTPESNTRAPRYTTYNSSSTILNRSLRHPNRRGQAVWRPPTKNVTRPLKRCESTSQAWGVSAFSQERNVGRRRVYLKEVRTWHFWFLTGNIT